MLKKYFFILGINLMLSHEIWAKDINILDRGAVGDGKIDNWEIFQKAMDEIANSGGGVLYVPSGTFAIYDKSLVIWGNNITIKGAGASSTTIVKKGIVGYFGDAIDIAGKLKGYKYYGLFGEGDYATLYPYKGENIQANNVKISSLHITSSITPNSRNSQRGNNLGIINSKNVTISDCIVSNANQTNVAIVNATDSAMNGSILLHNCEFRNSGTHNVRVISYNQGNFVGNNVVIDNSQFLRVRNAEILNKEIIGRKVHLWYRGAINSNHTSLVINGSYFDSSGEIVATQSARNLTIKNSKIDSAIEIKQVPKLTQEADISIENNIFKKSELQLNNIMDVKSDSIRLYPQQLLKSSRVKIRNNKFN